MCVETSETPLLIKKSYVSMCLNKGTPINIVGGKFCNLVIPTEEESPQETLQRLATFYTELLAEILRSSE